MIKEEIIKQCNNTKDCMAIAINVINQGFLSSERAVINALNNNSRILVSTPYLKAISEVTGVAIGEIIDVN